MLAYKLRLIWNKFVTPFGKFGSMLGISPNTWTLFSLLCSVVGGAYLYYGKFWAGLSWIIIMLLADMLDGATARATGKSSSFGTVFDHVIDRYAEFVIFTCLLMGGWVSAFVGMFSISGIIMASYVRAKAESSGGLTECAVGLAGRVEKLLLTYGAIVFLAIGCKVWADVCFVAIGFISHVTAVQRLLFAKSMITANSQN